ncbi:hypothetical protein BU24DRAFT_417233 [Aaosphaeria arxii CBS 175.79]|uniref:Uncharacterized protein n=1 Tax=Aaosphaeria arxii CBS 175.79 TaxID=1450172 RepID=A0A6A5YA19_9PLEO|nr:uncharacterized protein BU24DRAFT_417233 [Aaosphaeria arxii CBS 175.79]KAF2021601.1 hypothetical protein BU24DRAFT_417233 [Aaosphaeria arxii CBS 175.79]
MSVVCIISLFGLPMGGRYLAYCVGLPVSSQYMPMPNCNDGDRMVGTFPVLLVYKYHQPSEYMVRIAAWIPALGLVIKYYLGDA